MSETINPNTAGGDKGPSPNTGTVRRGDRQMRFLAQSVVLEEAGTSGLVRIAMITIALVICAFVAWASVTRVDEIAVTVGEVIPTDRVQTVQHQEGGTIVEIPVVEGQLVEQGQLLMRLDPTILRSEFDQQRTRLITLQLQTERLRAVGAGREPDFSFADETFADEVEDQRQIYQGQLEAVENRRQVLRDQIAQRQTELSRFAEQEDILRQNVALLRDQVDLRAELFEQGLTSRVVYLDVQRQYNDAAGDLAGLQSERRQTEEALAEARSRLEENETSFREQSLDQMGDLQAEISTLRQALENLEVRIQRLRITSPVRGLIKGLQSFTVGGVIPPGGEIMEIVPVDRDLIVETRITTRDVGHISIGDPVVVKVASYDFARYGGIRGTLTEVSATTFLDEEGLPYYRGLVTLEKNHVGADPSANTVIPGMTVQADIQTGAKTLLEYLLKPIYASVNESFRER